MEWFGGGCKISADSSSCSTTAAPVCSSTIRVLKELAKVLNGVEQAWAVVVVVVIVAWA
jgi:hypothetical protein